MADARMVQVLEQGDRSNAVWQKLKAHYERRLDVLRKKNDSVKLDEKQTAWLRGRIAEAKAILALGEEKPEYEEDNFIDA